MNQWHRAARFRFHMDELRVVMSLTVDVDVTPLLSFVRRSGLRFYPVMLWMVPKVVNAHDEFKLGWDQEDRLIQWRTVSPSYSDFHPEDEGVVKIYTPYTNDLQAFYRRVEADREKYRHCQLVADAQMPDFFDVSCLPWVNYRHFDLHVFDAGRFLAPCDYLR